MDQNHLKFKNLLKWRSYASSILLSGIIGFFIGKGNIENQILLILGFGLIIHLLIFVYMNLKKK